MPLTLRKLTLFSIVLITIGLVGVVLINSTSILKNHFEQQERNNIYLDIQQVKNAISQQIDFMDYTSNDWANWDDTYQYVESGDPKYQEDNLQPITFQNLNMDLIIMVNTRYEIVYTGMLEKNGQLVNTAPQEISGNLGPGGLFPSDSQDETIRHGLISINNKAMMIISHPVMKSDGTGPSHGTLLMGKYIDQTEIQKINNLLALSIEIYPVLSAPKNDQYAAALAYQPTTRDPFYVDLTPEVVYGYAPLEDIFKKPTLILRVNRYPAIYNSGLLVNNYLIISVVLISITFSTILYFLIEINVLKRIRQLSSAVQAIGVSGNINQRLVEKRKDELSSLAEKINEMLSALERSNVQRRESEDRFRTLVESMEDVVFTVERENQSIQLFDTQRTPTNGGNSKEAPDPTLILRKDLEEELHSQQDLLNLSFEGKSTRMEWSTGERNSERYFITTLSPIYNSQKVIERVVGVSKDITGHKNMEQDLLSRINELNALFHISEQLLSEIEGINIHEVICRLAVEQMGMDAAWIGVPTADGAALTLAAAFGLGLGPISETALYPGQNQALHPAAAAYTRKELILYTCDGKDSKATDPADRFYDSAAVPLIKGGAVLSVLVLVKRQAPYIREESLPLLHSFVNLSSMAAQNVYLFKQIQSGRERLQSLSRRMVDIQEKERREIALELHDEIGQVLTSLHFSIEAIQTLPPESITNQVHLAVEIIKDLIARVRQMSLDLRPSMLDDLGIVPTLIWYFDRYSTQTGIQVIFQHNNLQEERFLPEVEITVFRVVQEALTNVARYANVHSAKVRLWCIENIIGIQIEDEGVGFNQDLVFNSHDSKGLLGMRERVGFLGGQLHIVTQPGDGTCLTAEIPLKGILERRRRDSTGSLS